MNVPNGRAQSRGSTEMIWIVSITGLLLIAGVLFFFMQRPTTSSLAAPAALAVGTPLHALHFDDGTTLQILNIGEGSIVEGNLSGKPASSFFSSHSSGSSTSGMSGNGVGCKLKTVTINDQITGIRFDSPPANLLLEARLLDSRGDPMPSVRKLWGQEIRSKGLNDTDFPGWDAFLKSPENDVTMPEIVVQLSDGAGGWINGHGPYSSDEDFEHRGMIAFPAWPRSGAELEFRAARPGVKPVTWKMKNPSHATAPAAWTTSPLPQKQSDTDFELELQSVKKVDGYFLLQPKFEFLSKVPGEAQPSITNPSLPALECRCEELMGAWGTRSEKMFLEHPGRYVSIGFPYPPDEKTFRLRFVIRPTQAYPYPRSQALLLAKATVAPDGISFTSSPEILAGYGIHAVEFRDVTTGPEGGFRYTIKGRWNNEQERMAGEAAMKDVDRNPVCYIGEAPLPTGIADTNGSGSSSNGKTTEFDYEGNWKGPLQPGDVIHLGVTPLLPEREVIFTFEH